MGFDYTFPANRTEQDLIARFNHVNESVASYELKVTLGQFMILVGAIVSIATAIFVSLATAALVVGAILGLTIGLFVWSDGDERDIDAFLAVINASSENYFNYRGYKAKITVKNSMNGSNEAYKISRGEDRFGKFYCNSFEIGKKLAYDD